MTDLAKTIIPKSDQLNADDLIAGPITITITEVRGVDGDQPIAIHFEGDNRKPYKPCKSMRRVMVHAWKSDGNAYVGHRMTLYSDPDVAFGGIKVGGIRISHMSHIDHEMVVPLTVTRGKRSPYTVRPLQAELKSGPRGGRAASPPPPPPSDDFPGDRDAQSYAGGFGGPDNSAADEAVSAAVEWMRGVYEDLQGDAFRSTTDLDEFFADPANVRQFEALAAEDKTLATGLEAALKGRGKALASRERR